MTPRVVETADSLIANPDLHPITAKFPEMVPILESKRNWWLYYVHSFAEVDQYKTIRELMTLITTERDEVQSAVEPYSRAIEIGDMGVFLTAYIVRASMGDVYKSRDEQKQFEEEAMSHVHYMFEELPKTGVPFHQMRQGVFTKLRYNFATQLAPKLPPHASESSARLIFQSGYDASRALREYAKSMGYHIADTGLPRKWNQVFYSNGHTPDYLSGVRDVTLERMQNLASVYVGEFGKEGAELLTQYWEKLAPGMIKDLRGVLSD